MACDSFTTLMLHCDGADGSTSFPDSSQYNHTMTAVNQAQVDTAQFKFPTGSLLCDGGTDRLTTPDSVDFDFSTSDFTLDFWIRFNGLNSIDMISKGTNVTGWDFVYANGIPELRMYGAGNLYTSGSTSFSTATWYHLAFVRSGTNGLFFIDGTQSGTTSNLGATNFDGGSLLDLAVGSNIGGTFGDLDGWMDEIRVSKGIARWTTNFTPPTAPYCESAAFYYQNLPLLGVG